MFRSMDEEMIQRINRFRINSEMYIPAPPPRFPTPPPPTNRVVVFNGFPGTGKLTILKRVTEKLQTDPIAAAAGVSAHDNSCILLDSHQLIGPAVAILPEGGIEHDELRRAIRAPIFNKLRERVHAAASSMGGCVTILMTVCLAADDEADTVWLRDILSLVSGTNVPLIWIQAQCDLSIMERRLQNSQRRSGGRTKLTDVYALRNLLGRRRLISPTVAMDKSMRLIIGDIDVSGSLDYSASQLMNMILYI